MECLHQEDRIDSFKSLIENLSSQSKRLFHDDSTAVAPEALKYPSECLDILEWYVEFRLPYYCTLRVLFGPCSCVRSHMVFTLPHRLKIVLKSDSQAERVNTIFEENCVIPSTLDCVSFELLKEMKVPLGLIGKLCATIGCLRTK